MHNHIKEGIVSHTVFPNKIDRQFLRSDFKVVMQLKFKIKMGKSSSLTTNNHTKYAYSNHIFHSKYHSRMKKEACN
jgi:hypothetical protein